MSKEIRRRLRLAVSEHQYTHLERALLDDDEQLEGFVLAANREWTMLSPVSSMLLDGFTLYRTDDITRVRRNGSQDLMVRWLKRVGPWPPPVPPGGGFPLGDVRSIIEAADQRFGLVAVYEEEMDAGEIRIGVPESYRGKSFRLREVDSRARWASGRATKIRYADVTRIDFGDRYNMVLGQLA
jgi:hypothetical protein